MIFIKTSDYFFSLSKVKILLVLLSEKQASKLRLSFKIEMSYSRVLANLNELQERGLVEIVPGNRRAQKVTLTEKGERLANVLKSAIDILDGADDVL